MSILKVLIIEDEEGWQNTLEALFDKAEYETIIKHNHKEAWKAILEGEQPTMCVVDWSLIPGDPDDRQGRELLDLIKVRWPLVPVLCITAYGDLSEAAETARQGKALMVFDKNPFDVDMFLGWVEHARKLSEVYVDADRILARIVQSSKSSRVVRRSRQGD